MKTTHTPGKWIADGSVVEPFEAPSGNDICITATGMVARLPEPNEETEANARLIAAAPELLQALVNIADDQEMFGKIQPTTYFDALNTIRKATGEEVA